MNRLNLKATSASFNKWQVHKNDTDLSYYNDENENLENQG